MQIQLSLSAMARVLPEPAFAALLLELHEIFIPWTFVGIFSLC
jgi:hypothetical protein